MIRTTAPLALLALAACAAPPPASLSFICDREAQLFDKYGTDEDECAAPAPLLLQAAPVQLPTWVRDRPERERDVQPPKEPPVVVEPPVRPEPPTQPPAQRQRGNNGWGNGDQPAPGRSGPRNNAENNTSGRADPTAR